jgi:hypothetical protein
VKLGKYATDTLEMLSEVFGEHSLNDIHVSRLVEGQLKMANIEVHQTPAKLQKMLKEFEN